MTTRWMSDTAPLQQGLELHEPRLAGLAACIALLDLEARALGHPLAATLLAAAGEDLREHLTAGTVSAPGSPALNR